ncbi:hypothetical protein TSH7_09960 [Azospirillum sp. TSH7]|uniref:hypothetical protein n=1 Tax=unclassified Azospirillum TaxID=2630922 RepID=UPI000D61D324|nr:MULTISPECIES: hypothetical protein [unclassified Azospirillum]PWC63993.1 hypothetical protein TSH20_19055 [Azospirillum sp. TSH20]PWC64856.1 hypothetical protein TSH7_09960 [Azospirillum sp. TSH7]
MAQTRVNSKQVRLVSTASGTHDLSNYLSAAERGGKTLGQLMTLLVNADGTAKSNTQFRLNAAGDGYEVSSDGATWTNLGSLGGLVNAAKAWAEGGAEVPSGHKSAKEYADLAKQWRDQAEGFAQQTSGGGGGAAANDLATLAGREPDLDLLLLAEAGLPPGWFRRDSAATVAEVADITKPAIITPYAAGRPRFLAGAGGIGRGLLIEPSRTNFVLNSGALVAQSITLQPGTYTARVWGQSSGVSLTGAPGGDFVLSNTPQTFVVAATAVVEITVAQGAVVPRAIQIEDGPYATSYIATGTEPVTRAADELAPPSAPWLNSTEGTIFAEFAVDDFATGAISGVPVSQHVVFELDDGSQSNGYFGGKNGAGTIWTAVKDQAVLASGVGALTKGTTIRVALSYAAGRQLVSQGGTTIGTATAAGPMPAITRVMLGRAPVAGSHLNGPLRRFAYWRTARDEAHLNAMTLSSVSA